MKDPVTNACPISGPPNWENTIFQGISHPMENIGDLKRPLQRARGEKTQYKCKGGDIETGREKKQVKTVHANSSSGLKSRKRKEEKRKTKVNYRAPDKSPVNAVVEPAQNAINRCQRDMSKKKKKTQLPFPSFPIPLNLCGHPSSMDRQTTRRFFS